MRGVNPILNHENAGVGVDAAEMLGIALAHDNMRVELAQRAFLKHTHETRGSARVSPAKETRLALSVPPHQFGFDIVPITDDQRPFARRPNDRQAGHQMNALELNDIKGSRVEQPLQRPLHRSTRIVEHRQRRLPQPAS